MKRIEFDMATEKNLLTIVLSFAVAFGLSGLFGMEHANTVVDVSIVVAIINAVIAVVSYALLMNTRERLDVSCFRHIEYDLLVTIIAFSVAWILYTLMKDVYDLLGDGMTCLYRCWFLLSACIGYLLLFVHLFVKIRRCVLCSGKEESGQSERDVAC